MDTAGWADRSIPAHDPLDAVVRISFIEIPFHPDCESSLDIVVCTRGNSNGDDERERK